MTAVECLFKFEEEEEKLIKNYFKEGYVRIQIAKNLRNLLENRNIMDDTSTFTEILENKSLVLAVTLISASSLPTTLIKSKFGLGHFTDNDMWHLARNDDGLNSLVNGNKNNGILIFYKNILLFHL